MSGVSRRADPSEGARAVEEREQERAESHGGLPSVEFLFSTVNGRLFERNAAVLRTARRWKAIDQRQARSDAETAPPDDARILAVNERGLSKSRNRAIAMLTADIGMLCDDDIGLPDDAPERVARAFVRHPDADVILFPVLDPDSGSLTYLPPPRWWPRSQRILSACSVQIAFRREAVHGKGVRFDERFGFGTKFPSAEETIFLTNALRAGLRIEWDEVPVAIHPLESSGRDYADPVLAKAKGAALARMFGRAAPLWILAFAVRSWPQYRRHLSPLGYSREMLSGAREFWRVDSPEVVRELS